MNKLLFGNPHSGCSRSWQSDGSGVVDSHRRLRKESPMSFDRWSYQFMTAIASAKWQQHHFAQDGRRTGRNTRSLETMSIKTSHRLVSKDMLTSSTRASRMSMGGNRCCVSRLMQTHSGPYTTYDSRCSFSMFVGKGDHTLLSICDFLKLRGFLKWTAEESCVFYLG